MLAASNSPSKLQKRCACTHLFLSTYTLGTTSMYILLFDRHVRMGLALRTLSACPPVFWWEPVTTGKILIMHSSTCTVHPIEMKVRDSEVGRLFCLPYVANLWDTKEGQSFGYGNSSPCLNIGGKVPCQEGWQDLESTRRALSLRKGPAHSPIYSPKQGRHLQRPADPQTHVSTLRINNWLWPRLSYN